MKSDTELRELYLLGLPEHTCSITEEEVEQEADEFRTALTSTQSIIFASSAQMFLP